MCSGPGLECPSKSRLSHHLLHSQARRMSLSISITNNMDMKRAQAALAMKRAGSTFNVLDPAQDESFKGNSYDTTTAVRFAAQVTTCHESCSHAAEAVKQRDVQRFTSKFDELATAQEELPEVSLRVTGMSAAIAAAVSNLGAGRKRHTRASSAAAAAAAGPGSGSGPGPEPDGDGATTRSGEGGDGSTDGSQPSSRSSSLVVAKGREESVALRGVAEDLVHQLGRCRAAEAKANTEAKLAMTEAVKAVKAVPVELTTYPRERAVRGGKRRSSSRRPSAQSVVSTSADESPLALVANGMGSTGSSATCRVLGDAHARVHVGCGVLRVACCVLRVACCAFVVVAGIPGANKKHYLKRNNSNISALSATSSVASMQGKRLSRNPSLASMAAAFSLQKYVLCIA